MRSKPAAFTLTLFFMALLHTVAWAQEGPFGNRAPRCTNGTASGTYGYRMSGVVVGAGPILVNGLFTNSPDGTISGNVHVTLGGQQIPNASWSTGSYTTNNDCTGSGKFFVAALGQEISFDFIATDGGRQIELMNTNSGNAFHGVGRRISQHGRAPSCNNGTLVGTYGARLDGAVQGVPNLVEIGTITHTLDNAFKGQMSGTGKVSLNGLILSRTYQGTYQLNGDCTGKGSYTDSLGNNINYTFTVVEGGREIYLQGTDLGVAVAGVGRRLQ